MHNLNVIDNTGQDVRFLWKLLFVLSASFYKVKVDASDRVYQRWLKLIEHVMKCLERTVEGVLRPIVSISGTQFGFVPWRGTIDAIFMVRQLQEKYLAKDKRLYKAFVDL